jgi:hypothetical protein
VGSIVGKAPSKAMIKRVFEAAKEAGVDVQVVLDLKNNTMTATPVKVSETENSVGNDLDQWMKKHAGATEGH